MRRFMGQIALSVARRPSLDQRKLDCRVPRIKCGVLAMTAGKEFFNNLPGLKSCGTAGKPGGERGK